jgi:stage III sporulation protein AB
MARRSSGYFEVFLKNVSGKLSELSGATFFEIWREAVEKDLIDTSMAKKDKCQLIQLGENLGYLDKDMQLNTLDLYLSRLDEEIADLTKTAKEKTYLFRSLGIMAGIFISIIMI